MNDQMTEEDFQDYLDDNDGRWQNRKWRQINRYAWGSGNYSIGIDYNLPHAQWIASFKQQHPVHGDLNADSAWISLQNYLEEVRKELSE